MATRRNHKVINTLLKFVSKDPVRLPLCGILFDRRNGVMVATNALKALFVKVDDPFYFANDFAEQCGLPPVSMEHATDYMCHTEEKVDPTTRELTRVPRKFSFNDGLPDCVCIANPGKKDGGWQYVNANKAPYPSIFKCIPFGRHGSDTKTAYYSKVDVKVPYHRLENMQTAIDAAQKYLGSEIKLHSTGNAEAPIIGYGHEGAVTLAIAIMPVSHAAGDERFVAVKGGTEPDPALVKPWRSLPTDF